MKKIVYIALLLFFTNSLVGQNYLTNALYSLKNKELDKAKELIDAAADDSLFNKKASTWYYRGFIYKDLFKRDEADNKDSQLRDQAIEYFSEALDLEPKGTYAESCKNGLKYLAQTYYNQAAVYFGPETYTDAIGYYEKYKEINRKVNPDADFTDKDININLSLASTFSRIASQDSTKAKMFLERAKEHYQLVLDKDSNNISANYNFGIIYYNEGVEIVNKMDYGLDLIELSMLQDEMVDLFRKALPYMKKAYDLNPKRKETLIGLQGIYWSLHDIPKSDMFKHELDELDGSDGAKENLTPDKELTPEEPTPGNK